ncbi:MAG: DinB family protein [Gemmatimonadota bacterium]|nr:DinB family protein [Gemmatimonadota bacterium]MDH3423420.1 DinB family protein [Gemmatimonadota bacterium]
MRPALGFTVLTAAMLAAAHAPAYAQSAPPGFLEEFEGQFEASASKLVALAEAMPASTYDWSPSEGVASVARVYMHIARYNYMYPHENMGRDSPVPPTDYRGWEESVSDKDEVVGMLTASMDYVREVYGSMSDEEMNRGTMLYGRQVGEWAVLLQLVTHMNEHLGQSIAYARMNGVVPPWSR